MGKNIIITNYQNNNFPNNSKEENSIERIGGCTTSGSFSKTEISFLVLLIIVSVSWILREIYICYKRKREKINKSHREKNIEVEMKSAEFPN